MGTAPGPFAIATVAGDATFPYTDITDESPNMVTVAFAAPGAVSCRWATTDVGYSEMTNDCGGVDSCDFTGATTNDTGYLYYVACTGAGGVGNTSRTIPDLRTYGV